MIMLYLTIAIIALHGIPFSREEAYKKKRPALGELESC